MQFVNSLLIELDDDIILTELKAHLVAQLFSERYNEAIKMVDRSLRSDDYSHLSMTIFKDINVSTHLDDEGVFLDDVEEEFDFFGHKDEGLGESGLSISTKGMMGPLIVMKAPKITNVFTSHTKTRLFQIDSNVFRMVDSDKIVIKNSDIVDIRSYSSSSVIINSSDFVFEVETFSHSYSFGCVDAKSKDDWLKALISNREINIVKNSTYKSDLLFSKERSIEETLKQYSERFRKQGVLYMSIMVESYQEKIENSSIDVNDISAVCKYLQYEMLAAGMSSKLLGVLQELLLIPTSSEIVWETIAVCIKKIRKKFSVYPSYESSTLEESMLETIDYELSTFQNMKLKVEESGSAYAEVNKLAVLVVNLEAENELLANTIEKLELDLKSFGQNNVIHATLDSDLKVKELIRNLEEKVKSYETLIENMKTNSVPLDSKNDNPLFVSSQSDHQSIETSSISNISKQFDKYLTITNTISEDKMKEMMRTEHCKEKDVKEFFDRFRSQEVAKLTSNQNLTTEDANITSDKDFEIKFHKYIRMMKMLPKEAVQQKMEMDGFSNQEINKVLDHKVVSVVTTPGQSVTESKEKDAEYELKYSKYLKMKKMLPIEAVRQKMEMDGCSTDDITAVLGNDIKTVGKAKKNNSVRMEVPVEMSKKTKISSSVKLKGLFWSKLKVSEIESTVFHKLPDVEIPVSIVRQIESYFSTGDSTLAKSSIRSNGSETSEMSSDTSSPLPATTKGMAPVLGAKRTQNILIAVNRF